MPLFICDCCGAVDNTACGGNFWQNRRNEPGSPDLCCKCNTGEWHGKFPYEVCTSDVFNEIGEDNFVYRLMGMEDGPTDETPLVIRGRRGVGKSLVNQYLAIAAGMAAASGHNPIPYSLRKPARPESACRLPRCQNTTTHNGGYCCPEHCREHRAQRGKKVKALGR